MQNFLRLSTYMYHVSLAYSRCPYLGITLEEGPEATLPNFHDRTNAAIRLKYIYLPAGVSVVLAHTWAIDFKVMLFSLEAGTAEPE